MRLFCLVAGFVFIIGNALMAAVDVFNFALGKNGNIMMYRIYDVLYNAGHAHPLFDTLFLFHLPAIIGILCLVAYYFSTPSWKRATFFSR